MEHIEIARLCIPRATRIEKQDAELGEALEIDNIGIYRKRMKRKRIGGEMDWLGYEVMVFDHEGCESDSFDHFTFAEAIAQAAACWYRQEVLRILDNISTDEFAKQLEVERHLLENSKGQLK